MKFQGTALMSAVFLGLVLYYFFVDLPSEQKEKVEKERALQPATAGFGR